MATQENKLPKHVAIIMDGNGRWGEQKGKPRWEGHKAGAKNVRNIVNSASDVGLPVLTLWGFSTDNWKRPDYEIDVIMRLFHKYIIRETPELSLNNVKVSFIGRRTDLNDQLQRVMLQLERLTKDNTGLWLRIAINFSGTQSQHDAHERLLNRGQEVSDGSLRTEMLEGAPPYDLVIRTGNEYRVSDFPTGHAELWFSERLWPDFATDDFTAALTEYTKRKRRFGGVKIA